MKGEFEIIERYLSLCDTMMENDPDTVAWDIDQTVPQYTSPNHMMNSGMDFNALLKSDESLNLFPSSNEEMKSSPTYITDVSEQQINIEDGSKHFLDLDQVLHDNSVSNLNMKPATDDLRPSQSRREHDFWEEECLQQCMDIETMLISQVKNDICNEARSLGISLDPTQWNVKNVIRWIDWHCVKNNLQPKPNPLYFEMNGVSLCMLSEQDFNWKYPEGGSVLFSQLEIWRNACKLVVPNIPKPAQLEESNGIEYYNSPCGSPAPSVESHDSNLSSSPTNSSDESYSCKGPPKTTCARPIMHEHKQTIHLWQFLKELLKQTDKFGSCIKWIDRSKGIFKIEDSSRVAREWGKRKNRPAMNYDKLSRSIRQYYRKGIIKKTEHAKRLVYQFCTPYL
ncbi:SAM pointed domain-containing Ets transcription factor [Patella vulgata]|uniref:SAM pointed domain-containing Ets transcription factor n=1 Tax=Patella vulgata TaxID=6465 RepID=UPI00217F35BD|nr:SAM pointed domain-containing Ets transcription factor [Patella vulgata]